MFTRVNIVSQHLLSFLNFSIRIPIRNKSLEFHSKIMISKTGSCCCVFEGTACADSDAFILWSCVANYGRDQSTKFQFDKYRCQCTIARTWRKLPSVRANINTSDSECHARTAAMGGIAIGFSHHTNERLAQASPIPN